MCLKINRLYFSCRPADGRNSKWWSGDAVEQFDLKFQDRKVYDSEKLVIGIRAYCSTPAALLIITDCTRRFVQPFTR